MAEILATWLNDEVGLSKVSRALPMLTRCHAQKIGSFEEDFSSGYLLGELLWKFNQQADFELFSKK